MSENLANEYRELYSQTKELMASLAKKVEELEKQNSRLKEENEYLKRKLFGTKSETSRSLGFEQLSIFDEAETETNPKEEQFTVEEVTFKRKKKVKGCLDD